MFCSFPTGFPQMRMGGLPTFLLPAGTPFSRSGRLQFFIPLRRAHFRVSAETDRRESSEAFPLYSFGETGVSVLFQPPNLLPELRNFLVPIFCVALVDPALPLRPVGLFFVLIFSPSLNMAKSASPPLRLEKCSFRSLLFPFLH